MDRNPSPAPQIDLSTDVDEECRWDETVNHWLADSDSDFTWTDSDGEEESDSEFSELEGDDLLKSLQSSLEAKLDILNQPTAYETIKEGLTSEGWKKAEEHRSLGYNGQSDRTKRWHAKEEHNKEKKDKILRKS
jgi:hypothetical protein